MQRPHDIFAGKYELLQPLGSGAMSWVWLARHTTLGSEFALKFLQVADEDGTERLMREGRAMASLQHPYVVKVTDVVEHDDEDVGVDFGRVHDPQAGRA